MGTYHDLAFDERFALLVEREHLRRQNLRLKRRLKQAQLSVQASIEDVDFETPRNLKKVKFLNLAQGQWVADKLHLIVLGPTGTGKSFLANVLAGHLCRQGITVRYYKTAQLLMDIQLAKADGSWPKLSNRLASYQLLIFDEWLRDPLALNQAREMLDLIDCRYRRSACLFATQVPVNKWHAQIEDPTLADAILDRIVHDALRVSLKGESMRKVTSKLKDQKEKTDEEANA